LVLKMQATTVKSYKKEAVVLTTQEACNYLRISRPTYLKYICLGRIKGAKAGKGWKVLKSELDRFLKGGNGNGYSINGDMSISR
jgi:excisionase family DNA binding protein